MPKYFHLDHTPECVDGIRIRLRLRTQFWVKCHNGQRVVSENNLRKRNMYGFILGKQNA